MRSIRDGEACVEAAWRLREGSVVGTYLRGVCGLWANGERAAGLDEICEIKGEGRAGRPFGTALPASEFVALLDPSRIAASVAGLILDEEELVARLGSLCFIRAPLRADVGRALPDRLVSRTDDGTTWLQNWLPEGCRPAEAWLASLRAARVAWPVATSMNVSGSPEIVDPDEGRRFCEANGVSMFLADLEQPGRVRGSLPIVRVDRAGITLIREGHVPAQAFRPLLAGWEVDLSAFQPSRSPLMEVAPAEEPASATSSGLRRRLIEAMDGGS